MSEDLEIAHVGRPGTASTIRLARCALAAGASSIAAVVPYFFELGDDQMLRHFTAVADAIAPVPLIAYNVPARTGNDISAALFSRLIEHGIGGLKDSTKSLERHLEYLQAAADGGGVPVYMGSDWLACAALQAGATGLVSAAANAVPEQVMALRDAVAAKDFAKAAVLQQQVASLRAATRREPQLVGLKRRVERLLEPGVERYPVRVRLPLG